MLIGFIMSIHPPASISSAPTVQIFVKFDIGNFYYGLWRKSIFVSNQTTIPYILYGDLSVFPIVDSSICSWTVPTTTIVNSALLHHHGDAFSIYEGESNENLKSAIKIRNTARLFCKLTTVILMVWRVADRWQDDAGMQYDGAVVVYRWRPRLQRAPKKNSVLSSIF
jgi:hypothetical protein